MQFDHRGADLRRRLDLGLLGGHEQRDATAGITKGRDEPGKALGVASDVQPAFGGALLAPLWNQTDRVWRVAKGDRLHLVGRRHLEVQRDAQRGQALDVGVAECDDGPRAGAP